jgi:hypothetical protein
VGERGPTEHPMRREIMAGIRAGRLRVIEASWLAAVTPRRVRQWCKAEGIDAKACRMKRLKVIWNRALRAIRMERAGKKPRRQTKADLRRLGERAVVEFTKRKKGAAAR